MKDVTINIKKFMVNRDKQVRRWVEQKNKEKSYIKQVKCSNVQKTWKIQEKLVKAFAKIQKKLSNTCKVQPKAQVFIKTNNLIRRQELL